MGTKFTEIMAERGFDPGVDPPWQTVRVGDHEVVRLVDGANLSVISLDPSIAEIKEAKNSHPGQKDRDFEVWGKKKGVTFVEARAGGSGTGPEARLEVGVKTLKTVKVAFNFVSDSAKPPHHTKRKRDEVGWFINVMNAIYMLQAWVMFDPHSVRKVVVPKDLGKVVRWTKDFPGVAASTHTWDDVVALGDKTADFNVFFVWEYEHDMTPNEDDADAGTWGRNCLFEDNITSEANNPASHDATALAHEALHFFHGPDVDHERDPGRMKYLWFRDARRGQRLSKKDINTANP